jgi:polyisoprenoid-binding protein YceI
MQSGRSQSVMSNRTLDLLEHGTWRVDRSRSSVGFLIRHMGVATVRGQFSSFGGRIEVTDGGLRADAVVDVASVDTGDRIRDQRLRNEFFDAEHFPAMALRIERVGGTPGGDWLLRAEITIRGITRPVELHATTEPLDGETVRLRADGRIRRTDFGLDWDALRNGTRMLVADRVRLTADAVLSRG